VSLLAKRVQELAKQHGSLRAAARALEVDNPDDDLLRKMGLRRVVTYVRREGK
jgi:hypothetical protein